MSLQVIGCGGQEGAGRAGGVPFSLSLPLILALSSSSPLTDPHAAASYAFFNAFAAVGGFAGPYLMGALTFSRACAVMAACQGVAGAVLFVFGTWEAARLARVAGAGLAPAGPSGRLVGPAHSAPLV